MRVRSLTLGLAALLVGLALADPVEACHGRRRRGRCGGHSARGGGYYAAGACGGQVHAAYAYDHGQTYAPAPGYAAPMMTGAAANGQMATSQSHFGQPAAPASSIAPPAPEIPPAPGAPPSHEAPPPPAPDVSTPPGR